MSQCVEEKPRNEERDIDDVLQSRFCAVSNKYVQVLSVDWHAVEKWYVRTDADQIADAKGIVQHSTVRNLDDKGFLNFFKGFYVQL